MTIPRATEPQKRAIKNMMFSKDLISTLVGGRQ
jgi:hypothetical protein